MAAKSSKIADIKAPGKITPSASSRPLLVTNRPVLDSDPMVTAPGQTADSGSGESVGRTAKTIKPISTDLEGQERPGESADAAGAPEVPAASVPELEAPEAPTKTSEDESAEAETVTDSAVTPPDPVPVGRSDSGVTRDPEAESRTDQVKAEAEAQAEAARQAELAELIASGKYRAPINAVHRQHSRTVTLLLCLIALILAIVAFDVALDANLLSIPNVPHTNLLQDR